MNEWRILKRDEKADSAFAGKVWVELGTLEGRHSYSPPDDNDIGELGGEGEYLAIKADESYSIHAFTLAARSEYERVPDPESLPEAETVVGAWPVAEEQS